MISRFCLVSILILIPQSDIQAIFDFLADNPDDVGFIDAGSYVISDTVTLPVGANIVGECWAQLVASGPKFQ